MTAAQQKLALKILSNAQALIASMKEKIDATEQDHRFLRLQYQNLETMRVRIDADTVALVTITVEQDGLGAIDPPVRRAPTLADFEAITRQLSDRKYELTKP